MARMARKRHPGRRFGFARSISSRIHGALRRAAGAAAAPAASFCPILFVNMRISQKGPFLRGML